MEQPRMGLKRTSATCLVILLLQLMIHGCGGSDTRNSDPSNPTAESTDILTTDLAIDLQRLSGRADITLSLPAGDQEIRFESGNLDIIRVSSDGQDLEYRHEGTDLIVTLPASDSPVQLSIEYLFHRQTAFEGYTLDGATFTWPYFCGNLFPCHSEPADGVTYTMHLSGVTDNLTAIYPQRITADAPAYMPAWALGDYRYLELGQTTRGTRVGAYYKPGEAELMQAGSRYLRDAFDFYEQTYGDYLFTDAVASVSVDWGGQQFGGMEHHPYWHISDQSLDDPLIPIHEAAHGWYGNGVRIACWEDFVMSEGTATYLAARAYGAVAGTEYEDQTWNAYQARLERLQNSDDNKIAWPDGCNRIDILNDGLFGDAPYIKGAMFLRDVEQLIGRVTLDRALRRFYQSYQSTATGMQSLIDTIEDESGMDFSACASAWLKSESVPGPDHCQPHPDAHSATLEQTAQSNRQLN
ncbi:MAG: M1 family aminopeptidase [Candidatus Thiodiazotropha sp.]